jgi:hypothetical protein
VSPDPSFQIIYESRTKQAANRNTQRKSRQTALTALDSAEVLP